MEEKERRQNVAKRIVEKLDPSDDLPAHELPAELADLSKRERTFISAYLTGLSGAQAARTAGYGRPDGTSTPDTLSRIGRRLLTYERIQRALLVMARAEIKGIVPQAIQATKEIIADKHHKDRARVSLAILERADPTVQRIEGSIMHTHKVDYRQEALAQLKTLKQLGVSRQHLEELFGFSGLPMLERQLEQQEAVEQPAIDAEYIEVGPEE